MLGSFSRASRSSSSNQCSRAGGADAVMKSVISLLSSAEIERWRERLGFRMQVVTCSSADIRVRILGIVARDHGTYRLSNSLHRQRAWNIENWSDGKFGFTCTERADGGRLSRFQTYSVCAKDADRDGHTSPRRRNKNILQSWFVA